MVCVAQKDVVPHHRADGCVRIRTLVMRWKKETVEEGTMVWWTQQHSEPSLIFVPPNFVDKSVLVAFCGHVASWLQFCVCVWLFGSVKKKKPKCF